MPTASNVSNALCRRAPLLHRHPTGLALSHRRVAHRSLALPRGAPWIQTGVGLESRSMAIVSDHFFGPHGAEAVAAVIVLISSSAREVTYPLPDHTTCVAANRTGRNTSRVPSARPLSTASTRKLVKRLPKTNADVRAPKATDRVRANHRKDQLACEFGHTRLGRVRLRSNGLPRSSVQRNLHFEIHVDPSSPSPRVLPDARSCRCRLLRYASLSLCVNTSNLVVCPVGGSPSFTLSQSRLEVQGSTLALCFYAHGIH
jgi:hypothetical protein